MPGFELLLPYLAADEAWNWWLILDIDRRYGLV